MDLVQITSVKKKLQKVLQYVTEILINVKKRLQTAPPWQQYQTTVDNHNSYFIYFVHCLSTT